MRPSEDPAWDCAPGRTLPWLPGQSLSRHRHSKAGSPSTGRTDRRVAWAALAHQWCPLLLQAQQRPAHLRSAPRTDTAGLGSAHSNICSSSGPGTEGTRAALPQCSTHSCHICTYLHIIRGNSSSQRARFNFHSFHIGTDCHLQKRFVKNCLNSCNILPMLLLFSQERTQLCDFAVTNVEL